MFAISMETDTARGRTCEFAAHATGMTWAEPYVRERERLIQQSTHTLGRLYEEASTQQGMAESL